MNTTFAIYKEEPSASQIQYGGNDGYMILDAPLVDCSKETPLAKGKEVPVSELRTK